MNDLDPSQEITEILQSMEAGDPEAKADLIMAAYEDLRRIASGKMANERQNHTLTATALVDGDLNVVDGPFAESKELVGGYTIVEAPDLATACELAKKTIQMAGAGKIEVREIASMG